MGTPDLKALFTVSGQSLKEKVVDDSTSVDGASLLARLDEAIGTGSVEDLKPLWEYIKSRQTRLRTDLNEAEQATLNTFLLEQRKERRFILSKGALEAYLPIGSRGKDLEKLIRLLSETNFWEQLPEERKPELQEIVTGIAALLPGKDGPL